MYNERVMKEFAEPKNVGFLAVLRQLRAVQLQHKW